MKEKCRYYYNEGAAATLFHHCSLSEASTPPTLPPARSKELPLPTSKPVNRQEQVNIGPVTRAVAKYEAYNKNTVDRKYVINILKLNVF